MQWVEIRDTIASNGKTTVATCTLQEDGTVSVQTDDEKLGRQLRAGILNKMSGNWTPVTPKDGLRFLRALSSEFNSGSRWATKILNGDVITPSTADKNLPDTV